MEPPKPETTAKKKRIKMLRPSQIINKERTYITLAGPIGESLGQIELGSKIFITGRSFSGKSTFIFHLCKAFADAGVKVDYNSHEEKGGDAGTVKEKMRYAGIADSYDTKIRAYKAAIESDEEETFGEILNRKSSAGFAVLDSMQHAQLNKKQYIAFTNKFCNPKKKKIVAFVSHWQKNDFVLHVRHDCDIKLEAMNNTVYVESRMPGATNKPIVIWEQGARQKWGKKYHSVISGKYWPGIKK